MDAGCGREPERGPGAGGDGLGAGGAGSGAGGEAGETRGRPGGCSEAHGRRRLPRESRGGVLGANGPAPRSPQRAPGGPATGRSRALPAGARSCGAGDMPPGPLLRLGRGTQQGGLHSGRRRATPASAGRATGPRSRGAEDVAPVTATCAWEPAAPGRCFCRSRSPTRSSRPGAVIGPCELCAAALAAGLNQSAEARPQGVSGKCSPVLRTSALGSGSAAAWAVLEPALAPRCWAPQCWLTPRS